MTFTQKSLKNQRKFPINFDKRALTRTLHTYATVIQQKKKKLKSKKSKKISTEKNERNIKLFVAAAEIVVQVVLLIGGKRQRERESESVCERVSAMTNCCLLGRNR